jgi:hypothetical protein
MKNAFLILTQISKFTVAFLCMMVATPIFANAYVPVDDDLTPFTENNGTYEMDLSGSPFLCKHAFQKLDLRIDVRSSVIEFLLTESGSNSQDLVESIEVSKIKTYKENRVCINCGEYKFRIVAKGSDIIYQRKGFNILDPEWPAWRAAGAIVHFTNKQSIKLRSPLGHICTYTKLR